MLFLRSGGPADVFGAPGGGVNDHRRSGEDLKTHPQEHQNHHPDHQNKKANTIHRTRRIAYLASFSKKMEGYRWRCLRLFRTGIGEVFGGKIKENYPQHASIDSDGDFIIRTEITNPSLLYTVTFGLVGDNAVDPPLAPTQRPLTSGSQQIIDAQQDIEVEGERRSFFDIITLGIFN